MQSQARRIATYEGYGKRTASVNLRRVVLDILVPQDH
jgi:hypothetical protein